MDKHPKIEISIVSPVYRAAGMIGELIARCEKQLQQISPNYEIILVDDRSPDNSWEEMVKHASANPKVKAIRLSRNFGQHYAISAGLDYTQGKWVIVMDCDLQDRPEEIPRLYKKATEEGLEVVLAQRTNRKDSFLKKLYSKVFYRTLSYLTGSHQDHTVANFGIYHQKSIEAIKTMRESIRYFPTMVKWTGFNTGTLEVEHAEREHGSSNYNFDKMIKLALDIVLAYSDKPIRLMVKLGVFISGFSFLFAISVIYRAINGDIEVLGYASLITSIWLFSGLIIVMLGITGLYIGKIFEGVKSRPIYIVDQIIN